MIVGIDFDGTIVEHQFPQIGDPVPHAKRVIKRLIANGHEIILWTMRSDNDSGCYLDEAVNFCIDQMNFKPDHVNQNPTQKEWTSSPKAYCHIYIDDAALGCPLIRFDFQPDDEPRRPYVDWLKVEQQLFELGCFKEI